MRRAGKITSRWLAIGLLVASCSGSAAAPADPLGVQERLAAAPDAIGWQACTVTEGPEGSGAVDQRSRAAGVFAPAGLDAIASHQSSVMATSPVETYAFSGDDLLAYSEPTGPFLEGGWHEPSSIYDVAVSAADLLDPAEAVAALGVDAITPEMRTDTTGASYAHCESLPATS